MKPLVQAALINDRFGDPGIYLDFLFQRRAMLFDLGDLSGLSGRKLLRVGHIFVSHTHMDHFVVFDQLLRTLLGRSVRLRLFGPIGLIDRVAHKLAAYSWNLVQNFAESLTIEVIEFGASGHLARAAFDCRAAFAREDLPEQASVSGVLFEDHACRVRAAVLDHGIPCLAFALEEKRHVNVLKVRLEEMGLAVGSWLQDVKTAVLADAPDETPIRAWWREGSVQHERLLVLRDLRDALRIVPGQKIAYVTDVRFHEENLRRIVELANRADVLFIETPFLEKDSEIAGRKNHLTAAQAGLIARQAAVKDMVTFHFSPRYKGMEDNLVSEAEAAFRGH
jgi:ribonuclease Z